MVGEKIVLPGKVPPDSEPQVIEDRNCNLFYSMGYNDGFAKGQERGIKLAADILKTKPGQTIYIQTPNDEIAKGIIHSLKRSIRNIGVCRCEPTYSGPRPSKKE